MCHPVRNSPGSIRTFEDDVDMVRAVAVEDGGTSGPGVDMPGNLCMCVCVCARNREKFVCLISGLGDLGPCTSCICAFRKALWWLEKVAC